MCSLSPRRQVRLAAPHRWRVFATFSLLALALLVACQQAPLDSEPEALPSPAQAAAVDALASPPQDSQGLRLGGGSKCQPDPEVFAFERRVVDDPRRGPLLLLDAGEDQTLIAYDAVPGATKGVIWLSGADGGLDGPFDGFYARLATRLTKASIASVRLDYRAPTAQYLSVREVMLALSFLTQEGICDVALVGHSFGGAVAIEAGAHSPQVRTVVTLASQGLGTDDVPLIAPRPLLVVYPSVDDVVPGWASEDIYARAGEPKQLVPLRSTDHYLTDVAGEVEQIVVHWLRTHLDAIDAVTLAR